MKKLISILLALIMLMALAVPAMALDVRGTVELGSGSQGSIYIEKNAHLIINGDVEIKGGSNYLLFYSNTKLTVNSGCSLTGNVYFERVDSNPKIEIAEGGRIEMSIYEGLDDFISVLCDNGIPCVCEGNKIIAPCSYEGDYYQIRSTSSGKVFDVAGGNEASNYKDGTAVGPWNAHNQDNQIFKIHKSDDDGKVFIMPKYEGKGILYVNAYGGAEVGAELKLWHYGGSADSQWVLENQDDGKYKIISASNSNLAVKEDGSKFVLADKNSATLFELIEDREPTGSTISEGNGVIIAVIGAAAVIGVAALVIAKKKKAKA